MDALGTVRWNSSLGASEYYPYGVEYTATASDTGEKYATYTRDSLTGLDYAMSRYYYSAWGRFFSPDPYGGSARVRDPGSWNRYMYGAGDSVNNVDPTGLYGWGGGGGGGGGWGPGMGSNPYGGGGVFGGPFGCLPPGLSPDEWYDAGGDTPVWFGPSPWEFGCAQSFMGSGGAGGGGSNFAKIKQELAAAVKLATLLLNNPKQQGLRRPSRGGQNDDGAPVTAAQVLADLFAGNTYGSINPGACPVFQGLVTNACTQPVTVASGGTTQNGADITKTPPLAPL